MIPEPAKHVVCDRCLLSVNPVLARYLWVGFGWRGQRVEPAQGAPREQRTLTLCGPCGKELIDTLAVRGFPARILVGRVGLVSDQSAYAGRRDFLERGVVRD